MSTNDAKLNRRQFLAATTAVVTSASAASWVWAASAQGAPVKSVAARVVVIGGGNVAVDVALTAMRLGAKKVALACLESLEEMPANEMLKLLKEKAEMLEIDRKFLSRSLNEGFSGGEKKRNEIFQMAMLDQMHDRQGGGQGFGQGGQIKIGIQGHWPAAEKICQTVSAVKDDLSFTGDQ